MRDTKLEPQYSKQRRLARRQLLKMVGTSTATALLLPFEWVKPAVKVGYLPVHAQVSSVTATPTITVTPTSTTLVTLSNVVREVITPLETCSGGHRYCMMFNYNSPSGGVTAGTVVTQISAYNNGINTSFSVTLTAAEISGTEFAGTISYTFCAAFGTATSVTTAVSLVSTNGAGSNTISPIMTKPPGVAGQLGGKTSEGPP